MDASISGKSVVENNDPNLVQQVEINDAHQPSSSSSTTTSQLQQATTSLDTNTNEYIPTPPVKTWRDDALKVYTILMQHPYLDTVNDAIKEYMDFQLSSNNYCSQMLKMIPTYLNEQRFANEEDFFCKLISIFQTHLGLSLPVIY